MDNLNLYISNSKINPIVPPNNCILRFLINRHVYFVEGNHIIFETHFDNLPDKLCLIDSQAVIPKDIVACEEYVEYAEDKTVHGYFIVYSGKVFDFDTCDESINFYSLKTLNDIDLIIQSINSEVK